MHSRKALWIVISVLLSVSIAMAQDDVCPDIVADALTATDNFCSEIGRNEACYGNIQITAELAEDADEEMVFEKQGDIVNLTEIERLTLSPYVEESTEWGVALMKVQANIPDTVPGQGVTFLLFGDVDITNAGDAMEAFYFSSGVGEAACNEAESGIVINTPEGVGTVSLVANDVTIELGSTALLTAQPDDLMTVALTEGHALVTAEGVTQEFDGGFQVTIPINEELQATGAPSEPEPIVEEQIESIPDITVFTGEDSEEDDGSGDSSSEDTIVLKEGTWLFTMGTVETSDGCPPGFGDMISSQAFPVESVIMGGEFNLQSLMEAESADALPANTIFDNPSPNIYTMAFSMDGGSFSWTMTLESDSLMHGEYEMAINDSGFSCTVTIGYDVAYQG